MAFFKKRTDRAMDTMNERNRRYLESMRENPKAGMDSENSFDPDSLEKGDLPAIIIAGLLVFLPVILGLVIIVLLVFWLLG